MEAATFSYTGDPGTLRTEIMQYFSGGGFTVTATGDWSFEAELGSVTKKVMLGVFTKHMRVAVHFNTGDDGSQQINLYRTSSGIAGGAIGMIQANDQFGQLVTDFRNRLANAGMLLAEPATR